MKAIQAVRGLSNELKFGFIRFAPGQSDMKVYGAKDDMLACTVYLLFLFSSNFSQHETSSSRIAQRQTAIYNASEHSSSSYMRTGMRSTTWSIPQTIEGYLQVHNILQQRSHLQHIDLHQRNPRSRTVSTLPAESHSDLHLHGTRMRE
jgi:hypothetical protein